MLSNVGPSSSSTLREEGRGLRGREHCLVQSLAPCSGLFSGTHVDFFDLYAPVGKLLILTVLALVVRYDNEISQFAIYKTTSGIEPKGKVLQSLIPIYGFRLYRNVGFMVTPLKLAKIQ